MGESLERVQNKFACIIGELCNEPVVLSKFAIWLDLRLAEYKAKGAISLDGFGDNPDPSWLKGHEKDHLNDTRTSTPPPPDENLPSWNLSTVKFPFAGREFSKTEPLLNESITYKNIDNVSIKEEIEENDVEVITQWPEKSSGIKCNEPNYKRLSSDTSFNSDPSSQKIRRHSGNRRSPSLNDPTNQSLVSIIAESNDNISIIDDNVNPISNSTTTNLNLNSSDNQIKGDNSRSLYPYDPFSASTYNPAISTTTTTDVSRAAQPFQPFPSSSQGSGEVVLAQDQNETLGNSQEPSSGIGPTNGLSGQTNIHDVQNSSVNQYRRHDRESVRRRIISRETKSPNVIRNMVNVVMCLERWLFQSRRELRFIEEIPPSELDSYLLDFFRDLKKPSGEDYDPMSFKGFPPNLDRFLRDHNYPASIRRSQIFSQSHEVYASKLKQLKLNKEIERRTNLQNVI